MIITLPEYISTSIETAQSTIEKYTYPLFIDAENKRPDLIASCVVIEVNNFKYLVTASHVIEEWKKTNSPLYIGIKNEFIQIYGDGLRTISQYTDNVDVAFIKLSFDVAKELNAISNAHWLAGRKFHGLKNFFVHGFPVSRNKQAKAMKAGNTFNSYAFAHSGTVYNDLPNWEDYGKSPESHFAMNYGEALDLFGKIVRPIHPKGMSGGGFWAVPDLHKPENVYLAGIFIEYHKNDSISFSTKIEHVLELIKKTT